MSEALGFLLVLPVLVLGIAVLDAAGSLGTARHRTAVFAEAAATQASDALAQLPASPVPPSDRDRWDEVAATVEQAGRVATAGVCDQTDGAFHVGLISQPPAAGDDQSSPTVAAVVTCPVALGRGLVVDRVVATTIVPVR